LFVPATDLIGSIPLGDMTKTPTKTPNTNPAIKPTTTPNTILLFIQLISIPLFYAL
jgi:hypothetical protein